MAMIRRVISMKEPHAGFPYDTNAVTDSARNCSMLVRDEGGRGERGEACS